MDLYLHNTLSGKKEKFVSIKAGSVGMYHCGPTVYNYPHVGNLRAYVLADLIRRWFEHESPSHRPFAVKQVINITDVGHLTGENDGDADTGTDKMEKGAIRENLSVAEIAARYTDAFMADLAALDIRTAGTLFPKASEHIKEQVGLIATLKKYDIAYEIGDGIYFDTARFPEYGKLGNIDIDGLKEGARVEFVLGKRHATDFALWKFSGTKNRLQEWDPADFGGDWGVGFPGWHIECSAMAAKYLGDHFDIHTGGIDHIPVHHNNEIAQSEAALLAESGGKDTKPFVNYWLHNGFLNVDGTKISKSLGNSVRLEDFHDKVAGKHSIDPLAYKYFILGAHYTTPVNFTWEAVRAAEKALNGLRAAAAGPDGGIADPAYIKKIEEKVADDFNTAQALAVLWELAKDDSLSAEDKRATFIWADTLFGLGLAAAATSSGKDISAAPSDIQNLIALRETARANKDWATADKLREQLEAQGYFIEDK